MESLALKLIMTPVLIAAASLAGRRWGPAVGGWLIGLPFTSGPVTFFLALTHGAAFAAAAALGTLAGTLSQALFCLLYAWSAGRWDWPGALAAGSLGFALVTLALQRLPLSAAWVFLAAVLTLALALRLMPRVAVVGAPPAPPPRWDLPARMVVATAFVLLLTGVAAALGPQLTGLLAPFPLYGTILAVFAQRQQGAAAVVGVLRGLLLGLFGFACFFLALAELIERAGVGLAFGAALSLALAVQGVSLWTMRRGAASSAGRAG